MVRAADPIAVTLLVAAAVEQAGGAYFVGGSLASSLQGEPRATNDVDIVLDLPLAQIDAFVRELGDDFEVDVEMLRDALARRRSCNIFHVPTVMKVDIFGVGSSAFDQIEFSRRRSVPVDAGGQMLVLKSPEDTVLRKLLWYDAGGRSSERQWRDVTQVLRVNAAQLEEAYLERWADDLGIAELLERARADARLS